MFPCYSDDAFNTETKLEHVSAVDRCLTAVLVCSPWLFLLKTLRKCIVLKDAAKTRRNQRRISHSPSWLRKKRHPNKDAAWCRAGTILTQVNVFEQNH
jgi:hypothetical protein